MSSSNSKSSRKINGKNGKRKRVIPSIKDYKIIFDKMEAGLLKVDLEEVRIYTKYRGVWIEPYIDRHVAPGRYKAYDFVRVYHKGKRRSVAVHRLMWMVYNGEESIPDGWDVCHEDDDTLNNHYSNLDLEPSDVNQSHKTNGHDEDF